MISMVEGNFLMTSSRMFSQTHTVSICWDFQIQLYDCDAKTTRTNLRTTSSTNKKTRGRKSHRFPRDFHHCYPPLRPRVGRCSRKLGAWVLIWWRRFRGRNHPDRCRTLGSRKLKKWATTGHQLTQTSPRSLERRGKFRRPQNAVGDSYLKLVRSRFHRMSVALHGRILRTQPALRLVLRLTDHPRLPRRRIFYCCKKLVWVQLFVRWGSVGFLLECFLLSESDECAIKKH